MEIKINELNKGDVVLIGSSSGIKCIKLLRQPKLAKKADWFGRQAYSTVKCSFQKIETIIPYTRTYTDRNGNLQSHGNQNYIHNSFGMNENNHNAEGYVNLNYKNIYLIKKSDDYGN